jgi:hypothetical protein
MLKRTKNLLLGAFAALVFVVPALAQHTSSGEYAISPDKNYRPKAKHTLWYTLPATAHDGVKQWEEYSLPLAFSVRLLAFLHTVCRCFVGFRYFFACFLGVCRCRLACDRPAAYLTACRRAAAFARGARGTRV